MKKYFVCILGSVCSNWGKTWKRHLYNKKGICYRCGADKKDKHE